MHSSGRAVSHALHVNLGFVAAAVWLTASHLSCQAQSTPAPAKNRTPSADSAPPRTLEGFEGEIGLAIRGTFGGVPAPRDSRVNAMAKDGRLRVPLPDLLPATAALGMAYLLVEPGKRQLAAISDHRMAAVVIGLDEILSDPQSQGSSLVSQPVARAATYRSGVVERVAGYPCERWDVPLESVDVEFCVATLPTPWLHVPLDGAASKHRWAVELLDGNHLPLRVVRRLGGIEEGRVEVTSIKEKAVQANSLGIPAGYAVGTLAEMLAAFRVDVAHKADARP